MLGGIYIGLSGMSAYSKGLQTISNNVANLNTPGYKATDVTFTDLYAAGSGGPFFSKGAAAQKSGSGIRIESPLVDFSQGDLRDTGNKLDLGIQGEGFLILHRAGNTFYTRTGSFVLDDDGFIVQQDTDYRLTVLDDSNQLSEINLDQKRTSAPVATDKIEFGGNLTSTNQAASFEVSNVTVFDSLGNKHIWNVNFSTTDGSTGNDEWTVTVTEGGLTVDTASMRFIGTIVDPTTETATITSHPAGAETLTVTLDFTGNVTSNSSGNTIKAATVSGNGPGDLTTIAVDDDGHIKLTYSNGQTETLGAIALAQFRDPQALERIGDGVYRNAGDEQPRLLASGKDGAGTLQSARIEASNVDLSQEFGALILIQRGFQACSQVLSVSNDMIQQLFGVRGQS